MVPEMADIQYLLAETPTQAVHFEADLVRHERPRYNVKLRDDKHYPYIRINVQEPWPKTMVARKMQRDGARYFGPFTDATSVRQTLDTVNRDRKSTRLNSSHQIISYAVFCLKTKKHPHHLQQPHHPQCRSLLAQERTAPRAEQPQQGRAERRPSVSGHRPHQRDRHPGRSTEA